MNRASKTILWAFRCDYIKSDVFKLTIKGRRLVPAAVWRFAFKILCRLDKQRSQDMTDFLNRLMENPCVFGYGLMDPKKPEQ